MKKRFFSAVMTLLVSVGAFAQGNGIGGITEAAAQTRAPGRPQIR